MYEQFFTRIYDSRQDSEVTISKSIKTKTQYAQNAPHVEALRKLHRIALRKTVKKCGYFYGRNTKQRYTAVTANYP